MKAFLIGCAVVGGLLALAFAFRGALFLLMLSAFIKPDEAFSAATTPPAPDYSQQRYWAALPERVDLADTVPDTAHDAQADAAVDVFFVHPTTYYRSDGWNQPLPDARADAITDGLVLRGQAAVFNGCCRIYAPRYRQATLYSFFDESGSSKQALDLAYADVEKAFDYFLDHDSRGRPFILASHSQGSRHLALLLRDRFSSSALVERLVAAYPIGYPITKAELPTGVPVCQSATQTGCVVTWNSVAADSRAYRPTHDNICVNPLTWREDGERADFALNLGAVSFGPVDMGAAPAELTAPKAGRVLPGAADAQCIDGRLVVSAIRADELGRPARFMGGQYHIFDYTLFAMNLRENAIARVDAYLAAHANRDTASPVLATQ